jgi:hypothetical protein
MVPAGWVPLVMGGLKAAVKVTGWLTADAFRDEPTRMPADAGLMVIGTPVEVLVAKFVSLGVNLAVTLTEPVEPKVYVQDGAVPLAASVTPVEQVPLAPFVGLGVKAIVPCGMAVPVSAGTTLAVKVSAWLTAGVPEKLRFVVVPSALTISDTVFEGAEPKLESPL